MSRNHHACAVSLRGHGILITGPSGSGKTRLALALTALAGGKFVADDQVLLRRENNLLHASAPESIFGLVELRGLGPVPISAEPECRIDLVVRLVPPAEAPRIRNEDAVLVLEDCLIPCLDLAQRDTEGAVLAITGFLFGTPFLPG